MQTSEAPHQSHRVVPIGAYCLESSECRLSGILNLICAPTRFFQEKAAVLCMHCFGIAEVLMLWYKTWLWHCRGGQKRSCLQQTTQEGPLAHGRPASACF